MRRRLVRFYIVARFVDWLYSRILCLISAENTITEDAVGYFPLSSAFFCLPGKVHYFFRDVVDVKILPSNMKTAYLEAQNRFFERIWVVVFSTRILIIVDIQWNTAKRVHSICRNVVVNFLCCDFSFTVCFNT